MIWRKIPATWLPSVDRPCSMRATAWCSATSGACRSSTSQGGIKTSVGWMATQWNRYGDERNAVHGFRFQRRFVSRKAPEITGFSANRPNLVAGQNPNNGPRKVGEWLNAAAFTRVPGCNLPTQQFGNAGRNIAVGPGYSNWDIGTSKNFRLTESKDLQFRAEIFNVLNHANFHIPNSDINSSYFQPDFES